MDDELLDLCEQVYNRTGWECGSWYSHEIIKRPAYTMDFIIDSLPVFVYDTVTRLHKESGCRNCTCEQRYKTYLEIHRYDTKSMACYVSNGNSRAIPYLTRATTPLKALLRLTIAMHEAGELND